MLLCVPTSYGVKRDLHSYIMVCCLIQLASCLKLIPANEFKEQAVINMLYFIALMPVTVSNKIVECLSTVIVLPYVRSCDLCRLLLIIMCNITLYIYYI